MSKKDDSSHYRKLEDLSDLGVNSTRDNIIYSSKAGSKKENMHEQNDLLTNQNKNNVEENLNTNNNNNNSYINTKSTIENLESIYEQLIHANERIQFLNQEVFNLKQVIENKDAIIAEYESTLHQTTEKMVKLQQINENLKNEINSIKQNNYQYGKDNINNNQYLLDSINDIKNNLGIIEDNYNQEIIEKEDIINRLNYDLQMSNDNKLQINNILDSIYNQNLLLNTKINCLIMEKEVLLKEKEKDHKEIIRLNEILTNSENIKIANNINELKKEYEEKENKYIDMLKDQEKRYVVQNSNLYRYVIEREKEIENLKEKYQDVIMKLNLENESLRNKINCIENLPKKNKAQLVMDINKNI